MLTNSALRLIDSSKARMRLGVMRPSCLPDRLPGELPLRRRPGREVRMALLLGMALVPLASAQTPQVRIVNTTAVAGYETTVAVQLVASGSENALGFSIAFDTNYVAWRSEELGGGGAGAMVNVNTNQLGLGRVGFAVAKPAGQVFGQGTTELLRLHVGVGNTPGTAAFTFVDQPIARETVDANANVLTTVYADGALTITPLIGPQIVTQPQSQTIQPISNLWTDATFTVVASGSTPMSFQWQVNGTNIPGATNLLGCVPAGIVGWWPGDGDAGDIIGGNNGTMVNGASFAAGLVGQAFSFDGANQCVQVGDRLELRMTNTFSFEAWVFPTGQGSDAYWGGILINKEGEYEVARLADGTIAWAFANANPGWNWINCGVAAPLNQWTHVAVTYDGGLVKTYINGTLVHTYNGSGAIGDVDTSDNEFRIGGRVPNQHQYFQGNIDEVSIYSRALSASEVAAIYALGAAGKCKPPQTAALAVSTLTLPNITTNDAGAYRVVATNAGGAATSQLAVLTLLPPLLPPIINLQPRSQIVSTGETVVLSAAASGSPPLQFQWRFNDSDLAGATNATLVLTNVTTSQGGTYAVRVSNGGGTLTSAAASLTVNPYLRAVRVVSQDVASGRTLDLALELVSFGDENALGFSLQFDPAQVQYQSVALGAGMAGGFLDLNTNQVAGGRLGIALAWAAGETFSAGVSTLLSVRFLAGSNPGTNYVSFGDVPILRELADENGDPRPVAFEPGYVNVVSTAPGIVSNPGSQTVPIFSSPTLGVEAGGSTPLFYQWRQDGVGLAGADGPTLSLPGVLPAQAGNYDVVVSNAAGMITSSVATLKVQRVIQLQGTNVATGNPVDMPLTFLAAGDENGVGFSLRFDTSLLLALQVTNAAGATNAALNVNTNQLAAGLVGLAFAQPAGQTFAYGTQQVAVVRFVATANPGTAVLTFVDAPIVREVVNANADSLDTAFLGASVTTGQLAPTITQQPLPRQVDLGQIVGFGVSVTGSLPMTYQWQKNGVDLAGATSTSLALAQVQAADAGTYDVVVSNAWGSATSVGAVLEVLPLTWEFSGTPGTGAGVGLADVWSRGPKEAYALGEKQRSPRVDIPDSYLYRWDGTSWSLLVSFPGNHAGRVFGTGSNELWVSLSRCTLGTSAGCGVDRGGKVYRSTDQGAQWVEQALPPQVAGLEFRSIGGTAGNVQVLVEGGTILSFDGFTWSTSFSDPVESVNALTFVGPSEGYYVTCWGWGQWDGNTWRFAGRQFDFCEVTATWAARDGSGLLQWYAVGNNNLANGVRIWQFDASSQSFGGKTNFVFGEGDGLGVGTANGIWGSAAADVYVVGELASVAGGTRAGRIYHFDGSAWSRVSEFGEIPPARAVQGSGRDDVWVALSDGRLLHLNSQVGTSQGPVITTPPQDQNVVLGAAGEFEVAVRGTPPLSYQWFFNDTNSVAGATGPVLALPVVQTSDAGTYQVVITNRFGAATSGPVALNVIVPPVIGVQPQSTQLLAGAGLELSVVAAGATDYQWRKNGADIDGATNATFAIPSVAIADGGSYNVVVANDAGAVLSAIAQVIVAQWVIPQVADMFSNRVGLVLVGGPAIFTNVISGFSTNATKEACEPNIANRLGGRSVWYHWLAPATGSASFDTYGSTFDTLLGVYTGDDVSALTEVAANDDDASNDPSVATNRFFASQVRFNAKEGTDYAIAVDGFFGGGRVFCVERPV